MLDDPTLSEQKRTGHLAAIRREVDVMRKLRGTLNVACFEDAYEDDEHVHIVMEWCRGGELHHRIGDKHYSERTVCCLLELPPLPFIDTALRFCPPKTYMYSLSSLTTRDFASDSTWNPHSTLYPTTSLHNERTSAWCAAWETHNPLKL